MSDTLRDLIAAASIQHRCCTDCAPTWWDYDLADAILTALDEAGYTIVKRDTIATALAYGDEFRTIPAAVARHKLRTAAGMPTKRQRQQTPTTPNLGSIPAGEADAPTGGDADTQQQEEL